MEQAADYRNICFLQSLPEPGHHIQIAAIYFIEIAARQNAPHDIAAGIRTRITRIIIDTIRFPPRSHQREIRHMAGHRKNDALFACRCIDIRQLLAQREPCSLFLRCQTEIPAFNGLYIKACNSRIIADDIIRIGRIAAFRIHFMVPVILMAVKHIVRSSNAFQIGIKPGCFCRSLCIRDSYLPGQGKLAECDLFLLPDLPGAHDIAIRCLRPGYLRHHLRIGSKTARCRHRIEARCTKPQRNRQSQRPDFLHHRIRSFSAAQKL